MVTEELIPSIDKRISTWLELQRKKRAESKSPPVITVSREFGCEGYALAEELKEILDEKTEHPWTIFDNALIKMILEDRDYSKHLLESLGERAQFMDDLIDMISPSWDSEEEAFQSIVESVFSIAHKGYAIIVGRGAFFITRNLPNCHHIRLVAPLEFRAQAISDRLNVSQEEAVEIVKRKEEERALFLKRFLNCELSADQFHVVFNSSKAPIKHIAKTFANFIGELDQTG